MVINTSKSSCLRVGPRHKINCNNITNINKFKLEWRNEIRYLGVITSSSVYSCSFSHSKLAVYRSFNAIYLEKLAGLLVLKLYSSYLERNVCRCYCTVLRLVR